MKVINIERINYGLYAVTLRPNWLEKLFGVKEKIKKYRTSSSYYPFGGQSIYIDENGNKTSNGDHVAEEIDRFILKF